LELREKSIAKWPQGRRSDQEYIGAAGIPINQRKEVPIAADSQGEHMG
jgi:hypothetical protein